MTGRYLFIRASGNAKTGPLPVAYAPRSTCPPSCPLAGDGGCYGEGGRVRIHWDRADAGEGATWSQLCGHVQSLPAWQPWRYGIVGDLPHRLGRVLRRELTALVRANAGRPGWCYTHHDPRIHGNAGPITRANAAGFTVNLSADDLQEADDLADTGAGPVVVVLDPSAPDTSTTPAGRSVIACPEQTGAVLDCASCLLCQRAERSAIVGFRAHGRNKTAAARVAAGRKDG